MFSTLFPNKAQPNHGIFVENRLCHTLAQGGIEAMVMAPVPYFPFRHKMFGRYAAFASVPREENRHGLVIHHPRFPVIPKIGSGFTPGFLYRAVRQALARLEEPAPPADLQASTAFWYYGRVVALSSLGRVEEAEKEMKALDAACDAVPESRTLGNNPVSVLLEIGRRMAEGELEYRKFALLREAVDRDVALKYDEPWGWMQPVRHALGALLLEQGKIKEAESVYLADLELHPENGWALHGLAECQMRSGRAEKAKLTEAKFHQRWTRADIVIQSSCYCRRPTG